MRATNLLLGRGRQGKPRNVVNQTNQSLSQSALRAALMTPMKDIVAVGQLCPRGRKDVRRGNGRADHVKVVEREALQPTWPRA